MAVLKSFFDDRLTSCRLWPPWFPDPSPLDYFLRGYLKDRVYSPAVATLEDLKANIVRETNTIPFSMLQPIVDSIIRRAQACIQGAGGQFEHLL